MKLKDKVVLITGSSSGIGEATARLFASEGASVIINCLSNVSGAEKVVKDIASTYSKATLIQANVSNSEEVKKMFEKVIKLYGTIDILVNNAGASHSKDFFETTKEDWIATFDDNFFGTVLCSQQAAKIMLKNKKGKILNTSSIRGLPSTGREGIMAYSAAKAAVVNFTKTLSKLLAPNVQVNAIAPGFVYTPNYDPMPEKVKESFISGSLIKRWINVKEIAEAYLYLATADAVTGQVLVVDGGFTLKVG